MKFIHTADLHLGSKMRAKFDENQAKQRRIEIFGTFKKLVDYANDNDVRAILLAGDVFDEDNPISADKNDFLGVAKANPHVDFLYLRGNHDVNADTGENELQNLKTFGEEWTYYNYGDVTIAGIELCPNNAKKAPTTLTLNAEGVNIITLHGDEQGTGKDALDLRAYKGKNIDYVALGHIHKRRDGKLDERGEWAYSGCLEGRSFDETGEKGFLLLDVVGKKIERTFVPFAKRTFEEIDVDITGVKNFVDASQRIKPSLSSRENCYRINLVGDVDESVKTDDIAERIKDLLSHYAFLIDVKDKTQIVLDLEKYKDDPTLKGEFIRVVLADEKLSAEQKNQVLATGLKALEGRLK